MFLISSLHESDKSARDFIKCLQLAIFSRFMMTSLSSMTDSQFSMNYERMSVISRRNSYILFTCHCFVSMVINRSAYYFERFLNLGYILQMLDKNSFRLASSKVSCELLHKLMIDLSASSWMWSAEYLLMFVY